MGDVGGESATAGLFKLLASTDGMEAAKAAAAIAKIASRTAVAPLTNALMVQKDAYARARLSDALVRCGDATAGFQALYEGLRGSSSTVTFASTLSDLDKDGFRDSRLVPEMLALIERTDDGKLISIARATVLLEWHRPAWDAVVKAREIHCESRAPTKRVEPFDGEVMYPIAEAAAVTGISLGDIQKLVSSKRVFSTVSQGRTLVPLYGAVPCGKVKDDPDPRYRGLGARQT